MLIGKRLQAFTDTGSMGQVNDETYWRCYWPALNQPTALFAKGSSGIKVAGSSRNVVFPDDTVFLDIYPDALYPAEMAVHAAFPGQRRGMVELTPEMVAVYMATYDKEVAGFPKTHAVHSTPDDVHFLVHQELVSAKGEKPRYDKYVSILDPAQVKGIVSGKMDAETLKADLTFHSISDTLDENTKLFAVVDGAIAVEATVSMKATK